ncbi:2OG-Fe(II) oxygenase family protein [Nonomuraea sp. NPDC055795]
MDDSAQRAVGAVISEALDAAKNMAADDTTLARLRALMTSHESDLRASLATHGVDSLTWMAILTALENRFGLVFPDELASAPEAYTVLGLAHALMDGIHGMELPMKRVAGGARFRVIDDFLNPAELEEVRQLMNRSTFEEVASVVDPETDGTAFRSRSSVLRHDATREGNAYTSIIRGLGAHTDLFGAPGDAWSIVGFSFWKYAAGNRLSWHNDVASGRQGEFILFLHPTWQASWSGELLLLDADPETIEVADPTLPPRELVAAKVNQAPHCLTAIVPKPNRLVLVKEGTIHCIQRVDRTAGSVHRQTMTGFLAADPPDEQRGSMSNFARLTALLGSD